MSQMGKFISAKSIGAVVSITGDAGGAVSPDGVGDIDFTGTVPLTVTGTPGTNSLDMTVDAATQISVGVIEISTDAETVTGSSATISVTPASLKAKLGLQTQYGIPYGATTTSAIAWTGAGADGELLIAATGAIPSFAALTSSGGFITFTPGANTLDLNVAGSVAVSFDGDTGTATPALGVLNIAGTAGANITTLGAGSTISIAVTGTTQYAVQVGDATGSLDSLAVGATNQVLLGSTGANPVWGAVDLTTDVTGILPVPNGGTGAATFTDHGVLLGSGVAAVSVTAVGLTNTVLHGNTGADPTFSAVDLAADVTGILPVPNGGTGASTLTDHGIMLGSGVGVVTVLGAATDGQLPIGSTGIDPVLANITATDGTLVVTNGSGTIDIEAGVGLRIMTGFEAWTGGAPYFDDTTLGSFTVSQAGTGYILGEPITWAGGQTATGMTAGNSYLIYMDNTGTIGKTTTYSQATFENYIVLFECMRDSSGTNNQVTVKENHPYDFPYATSYWAHETIGVVIENHAGGANITLNGTQKIQINGADELSDHGLYTDIPDSGGVAEVFEQYYTNGAGKWARYSQSDTFDGTYNNAGTATALGANKYGVYKLYVSKDNINVATPVYFAVLHTSQYNNLTIAQTAIANGLIASASGELAFLELARLGYIIFAESSTSIVDVIIDKQTLSSGSTTSGTNVASLVLTDTTNFDHILSAADTNVQSALETIDDLTFAGDGGTCQAAAAIFTIAGGTGITSAAAGSTITIDLDTPVSVPNGGTGLATITDHGIIVGSGVGNVTPLAVGATGEGIMGSTGADPTWTGSPTYSGLVTAGTGFTATTLDVTITAGNLNLPTTNAALTEGVIEVNSNPFIHSFGTRNAFIGLLSGNGTLTGSDNIALGGTVLDALTSGAENVGIGTDALTDLTEGNENIAIGVGALTNLTTTDNNVAIGDGALRNLVTGAYNVAIGDQAGNILTTNDSDNILISAGGTVGDNNKIRIGTQGSGAGQQDNCFIAGIYGVAPAGATQNVVIDATGELGTTAACGIAWNEVTGTTQAAAINSGYITNNGALVTVTLPATAAVGSVIRIMGLGAGGWKIAQNASQYIRWDESSVTTTGVGGSLDSTDDHDAVELICTVTNNGWSVLSSKGNISIT